MAIHNPAFGVGMGQYGFYYPEFVGVVLGLTIWGVIIIKTYKKLTINMRVNDEFDPFGFSLLTCSVGMLLVMLTHDSFRYFGYWITLGLIFVYTESSNRER
ncbi:MAG: hypothetical protein VST71_04810 [Nitrospirota bacterium]|nr:hypothetical protein [Nitrospirota bacterium]